VVFEGEKNENPKQLFMLHFLVEVSQLKSCPKVELQILFRLLHLFCCAEME
jgi:hypothetical protein